MEQMNLDHLSEDKGIIYQVQQSRKDRRTGRIYNQKPRIRLYSKNQGI